ncbi:hypothetical protein OE88DRAFT_1735919 [Heliocybe sulcata]|uniref:DUF6534 domain-containing protein n=1 Tax=Heliocybe sulcata TaxID=5364 RepID=A0A5C3MZZ5_9AGAM|nr:hypothetical protein OE88DRAFT_1735919 [Heliocybe sulcata]
MSALTLDNSLGALFLGILVSAILFGVTNAQAFLYFHQCKRDPLLLKSSIAVLWLIDILHLVFIGRTFYWYAVSHFANLTVLQYTTWSLTVQVIITGISNLIARGIFLERIWRLYTRKRYIALIIAVPAFFIFVLDLVYAAEAQQANSLGGYKKLTWMMYLVYACAMLTDCTIAVMNTSLLKRSRADARPLDVPNTLVLYAVNTGVISGLCSACIFLTVSLPSTLAIPHLYIELPFQYVIMPRNLISVGFGFVLGKIYFNALLASLNARASPKPEVVPTVNMAPGSAPRPRHHPRPPANNFTISASQMPGEGEPIAINIETVTEQKVDTLVRGLSGDY